MIFPKSFDLSDRLSSHYKGANTLWRKPFHFALVLRT